MNATIENFGWPATLIKEWGHWVLLLRPAQPTLGSCVLAAKSDATAFGELDAAAHAELAIVTREVENALKNFTDYAKINYLMLMMVDPHVHFHVIPRYDGVRAFEGVDFADAGWPKVPDLGSAVSLNEASLNHLINALHSQFP